MNVTEYSKENFKMNKSWKEDIVRPKKAFGVDALLQRPVAGRRLLNLHGSREDVTVVRGSEYLWVENFHHFATDHREACMNMTARHEASLGHFGYSLIGLTKYFVSPAIEPYYVKIRGE